MQRLHPRTVIRWAVAVALLVLLPADLRAQQIELVMAEIAQILLNELPIYLEEGKIEEARALLKRIAELQQPLPADHPLVVLNDSSIATLLARNGYLEDARAPLERLLSVDFLRIGLFPDESAPERTTKLTEMAQIMTFFGLLYLRESDLATAIACYEKALSYQNRLLSPGHPDRVRTLHFLGRLYWEANQLGPAKAYLGQAALEADSRYEDAATVYDDLSKVSEVTGDVEGACDFLRKALAIRRSRLGPRHPETLANAARLESPECKRLAGADVERPAPDEVAAGIVDLLRQARELYRNGDFTRAIETRAQAAKLFSETLGPFHYIPLAEHLETALWSAQHESLTDARLYARPALYDGDLVERIRRASPDVPREQLDGQIVRIADLFEKLSVLSFKGKRPDEAKRYAEHALSIREKVLGLHADTAHILEILGWAHHFLGEPDEARSTLARSLEMYETLFGARHERTVAGLDDLATMCFLQGDLPAARGFYERALSLRRSLYRSDPKEIAVGLANVGDVALEMGDFPGAEENLDSAHEILTRLGSRGEVMAQTLTSQGNLLYLQGAFPDAQKRLETAKELAEEILDPEDPNLADLLAILGHVYVEMGRMTEARAVYERALSIHTAALGERSHRTANSLYGLGSLLSRMGDDSRAGSYLQRALDALEATLGRVHPRTLNTKNALAFVLLRTGDTDKALALLQEAEQEGTAVLGSENPWMASIHIALAMARFQSGDGSALEDVESAMAILKRVQGPTHPFFAYSMADMGRLLRQVGNAKGSIPFYRESLQSLRKSLGDEHYRVAEVALELSSTLLAVNPVENLEEALNLVREALEIQETFVSTSLFLGSEADKNLFLRSLNPSFPVAVHLQVLPSSQEVSRLALETVLRYKGRALDATVESVRSLRQQLRGEDLDLVQTLERHRATRAQVVWLPSALMSNTRRRLELERVDERIHEIEGKLALRVAELGAASKPVHLDEVRARLAAQEVLVELFVYSSPEPGAESPSPPSASRHYAAYVLHPTGEIDGVDLGPADCIDEAARAFHQALATASPEFRTAARRLEALTMAKLRPFLGEAQDLVLSPDGFLHLVPFAAMIGETGRYLVEDYRISYVSSGRDLLRRDSGARYRQDPLVVGGVDFDASPDDVCSRDDDFGHEGVWSVKQLESTGGEVKAIGSLFKLPDERILTGPLATEAAVKAVEGPLFLHLATHGFFLDPLQLDVLPDPAEIGLDTFAQPENVLLLSAVALRGFNQRHRVLGPNDGVLTALEVKDLDLWGTEVAVLSACETGLGFLQDQRGVFGLRRALVLAGAKTQVIALWEVADEPTKNLMVSWYAQLARGVGRAEAMRRVQLAALSGEPLPVTGSPTRGVRPVCSAESDTSHPYYWASFIVSGEKGPLPDIAGGRGGNP